MAILLVKTDFSISCRIWMFLFAVFTLKNALKQRGLDARGVSPVIRSDNGPQFISHVFDRACAELGLEHERIPPTTPNMNAHIESFHRIIQDDCLGINEFETYGKAFMEVVGFMDFYCNTRIHSSIGYLSQMEYYQGVMANTTVPKVVKV